MAEALPVCRRPRFADTLVLIKGAGDLASGVAYRLNRSGFPVIMTELAAPMLVRRPVCFGNAVFFGEATVEGVVARCIVDVAEAKEMANRATIPILIDPELTLIQDVGPQVIVDAIMAKNNTGTTIQDAPLVVALGPGFTAGRDCHAVIETNRGHRLGRVMYHGQAEADTRIPGQVDGQTGSRVLRAPAAGHVLAAVQIGERVVQGQLIASVAGQPLRAPWDGVVRGLIHPDVDVVPGLKIGDLDPRGTRDHCFTISDKSLAIGGGVLEAILALT